MKSLQTNTQTKRTFLKYLFLSLTKMAYCFGICHDFNLYSSESGKREREREYRRAIYQLHQQ